MIISNWDMEFPFDLEQILPGHITIVASENDFSKLTVYDLDSKDDGTLRSSRNWQYHVKANISWDLKIQRMKEGLVTIIDEMGLASAKAQGLQLPITSFKKLINSTQQRLYIMKDVERPRCVIGMLKVGIKRLYFCDKAGAHHEVDPVCILDFYVHESKQRQGYGLQLFRAMLQEENVKSEQLAIDCPSPKFLSFLKKHYGLIGGVRQPNNFLIFPGFFLNRPITRPPIFLCNGKDTGKETSGTSRHKNNNAREALSTFTAPVNSKEVKKNNTFCSTSGKFLQWGNPTESDASYKPAFVKPGIKLFHHSSGKNRNNGGSWSVHDALHSYQGIEINNSKESACPLTPVNAISRTSQRKWDELESSWNIFGVKPVDYSRFKTVH